MQQFEFHFDKKCTVWFREFHTIEAETVEEAQSIIQNRFLKNNMDLSFEYQEMLDDTITDMNFIDNNGNPTAEIWCAETGRLLIDNEFNQPFEL